MDPSVLREKAYRAAFLTAIGLLATSALAGIARSAVATHRLPSVVQHPLQEGFRLARLGRHREAREEFRQALTVHPWDYSLSEEAGDALLGSGDPVSALAVFQRIRADRPASARTHARIGRALLHLGRAAESEQACRLALQLGPQDAGALHVVGDVFIDADRYPEAIEVLKRAVAADPSLANAHNSLGVALALGGRPAEAVRAFEAALRLDPKLGTENRDRAMAAARQAGALP